MSSKLPHGSNVFGFILLCVLLGGFVYFGMQPGSQGGGLVNDTPSGIPTTSAPTLASTAPSASATPSIAPTTEATPVLFTQRTNENHSELVTIVPQTGESKVFFTDADESAKLEHVIGISSQGQIVATLKNDDGSARLVAISTDGSGARTTIREQANFASAPSLNTGGTELAYAEFSNAEDSFGFTLFRQALASGNASQVATDSMGIALPRWNKAGQLAAVIGQPTPDQGQRIIQYQSGSNTTIYTADGARSITDLAWLTNQRLLAVVEPNQNQGGNQATILSIDTNGSSSQFLDLSGKERELAVSHDGKWLAVITGPVDTNPNTQGTVTVIDLATKATTELGTALQIIGWSRS